MSDFSDKIDNKIFEVKNYLPNGNSAYFKCFKQCDIVCNKIKKGCIWEKELHDYIINLNLDKDSVIIEAGTHMGSHTILLSNLTKKVYGFEPFPDTYKLAIENFKLNNVDNIILSTKALSDENNKTIEVEYHDPNVRNIGGWGIHFTKDKEFTDNSSIYISIETITIDSLKLDKLDLIKLDVEGNELKVVKGGIKTIEKCRPIIILEHWCPFPNIDITKTKCEFNLLLNMGYKVEQIENSPDFIFSPI